MAQPLRSESERPVVILGGGLSGMAAAWALARAGWRHVTLLERGPRLGGLAGSFERDGHFYPLGYHHVLHRDHTLLYVLDAIGALSEIRWRRIRVLFHHAGGLSELGTPLGFLRFPMSLPDKARFVRLMLRAFRKADWSDWHDKSASDLVDAWAGPGVREAIFDPLSHIRFDRGCDEISGAWLGQRLHFREGSAPLGYQPGTNWTTTLCEGVSGLLERAGVRAITGAEITELRATGDGMQEAVLTNGERLPGSIFVNALPTEVYARLAPGDASPQLDRIRYTAMISMVCATHQRIEPDFYWMNLATMDRRASGIFRLDSLNPTIGAPGEACINFVSHLRDRNDPVFRLSDAELLADYSEDFYRVFGEKFDPHWSHVARVPLYSPSFLRDYQNPPIRSHTHGNLYFAGNYRVHPTIASTGSAMASGFEAARAILRDHGSDTDLPERAASFQLRSMPRA